MKAELVAVGEPYASAVRDGLGALKATHRSCVAPVDPRRLSGSIDLDSTLAGDPAHASSSRWDYGVAFRAANSGAACLLWIEVHAASPGDVGEMIKKRAWLLRWVQQTVPGLALMADAAEAACGEASCAWVAVGRVTVRHGTQEAFRLTKAGIRFPSRRVRVP